MAKITATTAEKIIPINRWLGLHESPDGDTKLKYGEAAAMENFRVTRDGNLQRRPGIRRLIEPLYIIRGLWTGYVNQKEVFLASWNGHVYSLWDATANNGQGDWYKTDGVISPVDIGTVATTRDIFIFGFEGKAYFMDGNNYKVWDGVNNLAHVTGYIPLVAISIAPDGANSETLEQINKLTAKRRAWLSPDGTGKVFYLPEKGMYSIDSITKTSDGSSVSDWTSNTTNGTVTFTSAPAQGVNSLEVTWTMTSNFVSPVKAMRYAEIFSGMTDSRVFLYGDGSNKMFYSSIDYWGKPRADYFPDLNEAAVGDENTPITALIRHYSKLAIFKSTSTWSCSFDLTTFEDGTTTEALYIYPVNKRIGNAPMGQVMLVMNSPRSLFGNDVYEWKNNNAYSANLSVDERQAKRISDNIYKTISQFDLKNCVCWDDNDAQEYWIVQDAKVLVHNYAIDAWYYYDLNGFYVRRFCNFHKKLYIGTTRNLCFFDEELNYDDSASGHKTIKSYWESGSMAFGQDYMRKYSAMLWLGIKPTSAGEVTVTVQTDRKPATTEKVVVSKLATLANVDFGNWSFNTNQQPHIFRRKIKAKKFVYYKLIFKNEEENTSATITASDIRVRYTGYAK